MDQPLVIEIVDSKEKIQALLPLLDKMMGGGLLTLEKVRVINYGAGQEQGRGRRVRPQARSECVLPPPGLGLR